MEKIKKVPMAPKLRLLFSEMALGCAMFAKDIPWKRKVKMIKDLNKDKEGKIIVKNFFKRLKEVEKIRQVDKVHN